MTNYTEEDRSGINPWRKLKVLIVAYASNPYLGSEPGVGWEGICRAAKAHDVFVITGLAHKKDWDRAAVEGLIPANVKVRFLCIHKPYSEHRTIAQLQSWLRYRDFNRIILGEALQWHAEQQFDICHQVNIASWRMPSPLWKMPIPFIWGPLGGAGFIPHKFRSMLSIKARIFESARDLHTFLTSHSKDFIDTMRQTTLVIAANEETELFLKPWRTSKPMCRVPVASLGSQRLESIRQFKIKRTNDQTLKLFAGGRIQGSKGYTLALSALARVAEKGIRFKYTIAGCGPETESLTKLAAKLGISDMVEVVSILSGQEYTDTLNQSDICLLPSFRETLGITMVEAMIAGCYAIVANTSAQGEIVRMAGGTAVEIRNRESVINGIVEAIIWCNSNRESMRETAREAGEKVEKYFNSDHHDRVILNLYESIIRGA